MHAITQIQLTLPWYWKSSIRANDSQYKRWGWYGDDNDVKVEVWRGKQQFRVMCIAMLKVIYRKPPVRSSTSHTVSVINLWYKLVLIAALCIVGSDCGVQNVHREKVINEIRLGYIKIYSMNVFCCGIYVKMWYGNELVELMSQL